ncbi:hypothetical protein V3481_017539 [Fusarium oxysporum f. sp. vasinfectum]
MASQYPKNQTPGFINTIKTAAIVGAKGEIGKEFTEHLLKSGNQTVTTLTRNGSKTAVPGGVKLAHVDYNDEASLVEALKGQLKAFQVAKPGRWSLKRVINLATLGLLLLNLLYFL